MPKISELPALTTPSTNNQIPIVDSGVTKSITVSNLLAGVVAVPGAVTDNAVLRFDLTTGRLIQNSLITITDAGGVLVSSDTSVSGGSTVVPLTISNYSQWDTTFNGSSSTRNEILFKPRESNSGRTDILGHDLVYGYGVISWYCDDLNYTQKDVIMQAHRTLYNTDGTHATDIHRHWSIYTSNSAHTDTIKRINLEYGEDYANWDFDHTYISMGNLGEFEAFGINNTSDNAFTPTLNSLVHWNGYNLSGPSMFDFNMFPRSASTARGMDLFGNSNMSAELLYMDYQGTGVAVNFNSTSTTNPAVTINSKYNQRNTVNVAGGYGLLILTNGTATTSPSIGLVTFQNTTVSDSANMVTIDNRSAGKGFVIKNNTTEYFSIGNTGIVSVGGTNPATSAEGVLNINMDWDRKVVFWGDVDEGYCRLEFRPERRTGADQSDVQFTVHHFLHNTVTVHKHLSLYTSNLAGDPTKRFNWDYGADVADFDIDNTRVIINSASGYNGLQIIDSSVGTAAVSQLVSSYSIFIPAVQSSVYKGILGIAESSTGNVNAAMGVYDDGVGGKQGFWFATGDSTTLTKALHITSTGKVVAASEVNVIGDLNHDGTNVGFYGATPVARQLLATGAGATVDQVITALQALGLLRQS